MIYTPAEWFLIRYAVTLEENMVSWEVLEPLEEKILLLQHTKVKIMKIMKIMNIKMIFSMN